MKQKTDEQLYRLLADHDRDAFDILYKRYGRLVYAYFHAVESDHDLVKDLVQDTWLRIIQHAVAGKAIKTFRPWLFTIATNLYRDALRRKKIRWPFSLIKPVSNDKTSQKELEDKNIQTKNFPGFSEDFQRVLQQLPPRQKQIFILKQMFGFKHEEIGAMLGIATGTCKVTYHNSIANLRKTLADYEYFDQE